MISQRTAYIGKVYGLYCLLFGLTMLAHKDAIIEAVMSLPRIPGMSLWLGIVILGVGLAIVSGHNVWSGGAVAVVVTVLGWLTLLKGLVLISLSPQGLGAYIAAVHYEQFYYLFAALTTAVGAYLTFESLRMKTPG
jgi:hypothetical protein